MSKKDKCEPLEQKYVGTKKHADDHKPKNPVSFACMLRKSLDPVHNSTTSMIQIMISNIGKLVGHWQWYDKSS